MVLFRGYVFREIIRYHWQKLIVRPYGGDFLPERLTHFLVNPLSPIIVSSDHHVTREIVPAGVSPLWGSEKIIPGYESELDIWYDLTAMKVFFKNSTGFSLLLVYEEGTFGYRHLEQAIELSNSKANNYSQDLNNNTVPIDWASSLMQEDSVAPSVNYSLATSITGYQNSIATQIGNFGNWCHLGYDVVDLFFSLSGLTNCGYADPIERSNRDLVLGRHVNEFHLISDFQKAVEFAEFSDINVLEHKPFIVCSIYIEKIHFEQLRQLALTPPSHVEMNELTVVP